MHLCQVAPYVTYPPRMGGDHRTHGLVKEFPGDGHTVQRYCQGGSPAMYKSLDLRRHVRIADGYDEHRHLNPLHEAMKAPMLLGYPNLLAHRSLRIANDGIDAMFEDADVVLAREPWQMPYVLDHVPASTPIIFSSHNVETERFGDIEQPVLTERVEREVDRLERRSVEETDAIVCTSEHDAEVYRERYDPSGPILVAPNGTYEDSLRSHRPDSDVAECIRQRYGIASDAIVSLFMGSNYRPNVEAAEAVVDMAHELADADFDAQFLVLGSVGNALDRPSLPDNLTTTGYVEAEFEAHFDAADIALNPMLSGGGTNIKLIDYFARSLPVVSTRFGARGLDGTAGEELLVADIDNFPERITALAEDPGRRRRVGDAGRRLAADRYTWEASSRALREFVVEEFGPF
ncbi:glycosyltransferase family 4 protein [Halopenitus persicus]|uniref:Glycosyltransferase involved in cell wall bisynthesis n=1 Tax=Halopenitus persicus TaxID=1048396 RepID=A0A1H3MM96_9EURY|nr:glycosyltransferase family 4 protein [Halopenitus persicus]SDY77777.1 Glycosyltransferase involved in cell wall bisynthesis [Halopenitus persicus]